MTLQPLNGQASAGVALEEQPLGKSGSQQNQEYELIPAGDRQYYIRLKGSEFYLTPLDASGGINSSINLKAKQDGDLQRWVLIEQHPTM